MHDDEKEEKELSEKRTAKVATTTITTRREDVNQSVFVAIGSEAIMALKLGSFDR